MRENFIEILQQEACASGGIGGGLAKLGSRSGGVETAMIDSSVGFGFHILGELRPLTTSHRSIVIYCGVLGHVIGCIGYITHNQLLVCRQPLLSAALPPATLSPLVFWQTPAILTQWRPFLYQLSTLFSLFYSLGLGPLFSSGP